MASIAQRIIAENTLSLELIKAYKTDGRAFYAYIVIRVADMDKINAMDKSIPLELPKNCKVLHSDFGHDVPDWVHEAAMQKFRAMFKA